MMLRMQVALALPVLLGVQPPQVPPPPTTEPLVSVAWLAQRISDPDLVLLHVGPKAEYAAGHIAGARYVALDDISQPHDRSDTTSLALEMLSPGELRARLERLGISDDSRIIVYYGNDWVSPATRVIFTLDYAGLGARTSLLDGGMQAWQRAGHRVTADAPAATTGRLSALRTRNSIVAADFVAARAGRPGFAIVDARNRAFYDGVQAGTGGRKGHVPGAVSVPFHEITDERLHIRSRAELEELFRNAGVRPGDVVVGYCHIGQQATVMLFAARLLGHDVLLYDGSFQDWSLRGKPIAQRAH